VERADCRPWAPARSSRASAGLEGRSPLDKALPDYRREYREWMAREPCAGLLAALERRIRAGQTIALACWCETAIDCHRSLIGDELAGRGLMVVWL